MDPSIPDPALSLLVGLGILGLFLVLVWPRRRSWPGLRRPSARVLREDILKVLHRNGSGGRPFTTERLARALRVSVDQANEILNLLSDQGLVSTNQGPLRLTPEGMRAASLILRAHRLWERHLAEETGFPETEWHTLAERREHELSPGEVEALSVRLGRPTHDPHGDPIPAATGEVLSPRSVSLLSLRPGAAARIVHLEDEPEERYAELAAEGLYPGQIVRMIDGGDEGFRVLADDEEHILSALAAGNISVLPLPASAAPAAAKGEPLSVLRPGEKGTVMHISARCRGAERRRLLDLGLLAGTSVEAEISAASGDPTAYRVRGALLALRRDQARFIRIEREGAARP